MYAWTFTDTHDLVNTQDTLFGMKVAKRRLENVVILQRKKLREKSQQSSLLPSKLPQIGLGMTKALTKRSVYIETLSTKKFVEGTSVLGYILHIAKSHVVVGLPSGITASVPAIHASDVFFAKSQQSQNVRI
jgi:hypothetical protein